MRCGSISRLFGQRLKLMHKVEGHLLPYRPSRASIWCRVQWSKVVGAITLKRGSMVVSFIELTLASVLLACKNAR
jgi:hypothetical protein